jgi:hypothetical protein
VRTLFPRITFSAQEGVLCSWCLLCRLRALCNSTCGLPHVPTVELQALTHSPLPLLQLCHPPSCTLFSLWSWDQVQNPPHGPQCLARSGFSCLSSHVLPPSAPPMSIHLVSGAPSCARAFKGTAPNAHPLLGSPGVTSSEKSTVTARLGKMLVTPFPLILICWK